MICSRKNPGAGRFAWVLACATGLFVFAPSSKASLSFTNGSFETCSATSGGSAAPSCPAVASGNGGFAFGDTPGGLGNYMQAWTMLNPNNLHCVVTNPSKDNNVCGSGWTGGSSNLTLYALAPTSPDGGNYVVMDADTVHGYNGTIYQTVSGLVQNQLYFLTFYQAAGQQTGNQGSATDWWSVDVGGTVNGTSVTGGTTFGSQTQNDIFWRDQSHLTPPDTPTWQKITYAFTASATTEIISFTSSSLMSNTTTGVPPYLFLDGVNLTAAPEPSSIFLAALGIAGLLLLRKRIVKRTPAARAHRPIEQPNRDLSAEPSHHSFECRPNL